jgi:ribosomal protein L40E
MKTILHYYGFDTSDRTQAEQYKVYRSNLLALGLKCFSSISPDHTRWYKKIAGLDGHEITLETAHIFDNQWNIAEGLRVFDWSEAIYPNKRIKEGIWLEQTEEMRAIRRDTYQCGYCGKVSPKADKYCRKCLGSEYLREKELTLLLLVSARDRWRAKRPDVVPEWLVVAWKEAQGLGKISREKALLARKRKQVAALVPDAEKKAARLIANAKIEAEGKTWLLDHELNIIDNAIFYDHTQTWGFGWRDSLASNPPDLTGFPFPYEVE